MPRLARCFPFALALSALFGVEVFAQTSVGLYVAVPTPLTSDAVTRITNRIEAARNLPEGRPSQIVLDFNPTDKDAAGSSFGTCSDLAEYLAKLHDVGTIAFIHGKVMGHACLPALACKQIVMGKDSTLGEVIRADDPPLTERQAFAYTSILQPIRPDHIALARKMFDKNVNLVLGSKEGGTCFVDLRDEAAFAKQGISVPNRNPLPPDGRTALFSNSDLLKWRVCNGTAASRGEIAETYGLVPGSLRDDPLNGRAPVAFRYVLKGVIDKGVAESVARIVRGAIDQKGNIFFLQLECGGGDIQAARELADQLQKLQSPEDGSEGILIVAFVPNEAPDTAAVIALGCSEIVMSRRGDTKDAEGGAGKESVFGNFEILLSKPGQNPQLIADSLKPLAEKMGYPAVLIEGMLLRDLVIVKARSKVDRNKYKFFSDTELKANNDKWELAQEIKSRGQLLKLTATEAQKYGLVKSTTETSDAKELYSKYGIDAAKVKDATPAWLDRFANFLRDRVVTVLLVVIGFTGLILELKVPGATVPGIIAALCFILVFWAHTGFHGQVVVLAGLLFLLGLVLVLMEVFVFPGFGATGIVGIALMLGSLALVTVDELPKTSTQWIGFGARLGQYLFGLIAAVILSFTVARYMRRIPFLNKMSMKNAEDTEPEPVLLPGAAKAARLLGAIGAAATVLRPAGTVKFGDEFVDVVTEGGFIQAGARVQVVEVEGTRIVVKEV